jgi:hypothetical protein
MRRRARLIFLGGFLVLIYGVPLFQAGVEITRGRLPQALDVFRSVPTRPNLRAFEHQLEEDSLPAQEVRPWVQHAWFRLLGNAGEKVVVGRDGWLFYKPDMQYLVEPYEGDEVLAAIVDFRDQLARRGIHLLVMPVPGKPTVYPDRLTSRANGEKRLHSHTLELLAALRQAGIETPDLFDLFAGLREKPELEPWYLRRDTHWSGGGARLAAEVIAQRIRALGWVELGDIPYRERDVVVKRRSDIAHMIRVPDIESQYPDERVLCRQVVRADTGELYRDSPDSPVLVLGDSFLRMYQTDAPRDAGFIAHLARELRRPLASVVNDGGASTLVRQELHRRPELLAGKRVVIWEFVERDIRFGMEGWKKVDVGGAVTADTRGFTPIKASGTVNNSTISR